MNTCNELDRKLLLLSKNQYELLGCVLDNNFLCAFNSKLPLTTCHQGSNSCRIRGYSSQNFPDGRGSVCGHHGHIYPTIQQLVQAPLESQRFHCYRAQCFRHLEQNGYSKVVHLKVFFLLLKAVFYDRVHFSFNRQITWTNLKWIISLVASFWKEYVKYFAL